MSLQIVMDSTGDTRHEFEASDARAVAEAQRRFEDLVGKGYRAVAFKDGERSGEVANRFDPTIAKTMFIPRLVGG